MTPRSKLYFAFKSAYRLTGTVAGRQKLAAIGVYPMDLTVSGTHLPESQTGGYFIDCKGRIIGTSNVKPKQPVTLSVNLPARTPYDMTFKIELASPDVLNNSL